ncbi:MAG TPA: DUF2007 domain-containing protein [Burkholderiaceae bacterium]|jgi:hypothetical protein|nr:DUF2007 domain-containing protein [Burkholderiaceae bacterium]
MSDQRSELVETFRAMSDGELVERWRSGNLTEIAAEVARAELVRRHMAVPDVIASESADDDTSAQGAVTLVTVARSLEPLQIEMLRARLEAEGIPAFAVDAGINRINPFYSIAVGGVRLMVPRESADDARRIVDLVRSGGLALREDDDLG